MANKSRLGQQWYIYDDATGECKKVYVNDETALTVELLFENSSSLFDNSTKKRFYTEYVNFLEEVTPRTIQ